MKRLRHHRGRGVPGSAVLILCALFVALLVASPIAYATAGSDDFTRADGGLAPAWTAISDGGLSISAGTALGTSGLAGDIRTGETYASDQYSSVQVTSTQLSGGQWLGAAVR